MTKMILIRDFSFHKLIITCIFEIIQIGVSVSGHSISDGQAIDPLKLKCAYCLNLSRSI